MLPLQKIKGRDNMGDLMTKHVDEQTALRHVAGMQMRFAQGRPRAAANLHSLKNKGPNKGGDSWDCRGKLQVWRRRHQEWRTKLFAPDDLQDGPRNLRLATIRLTTGQQRDGTRFTTIDDWTQNSAQEERREERCGHATFFQA